MPNILKRNIRPLGGLIILLSAVACTTKQHYPPYVYAPPVVVTMRSLHRTNNWSILVFKVTNVSSNSMWYDGEGKNHPAMYIDYKSKPADDFNPGMFWGDSGLGRYELASGESIEVKRGAELIGTFRAGFLLSPFKDPKSLDDQVFWSDYVSP